VVRGWIGGYHHQQVQSDLWVYYTISRYQHISIHHTYVYLSVQ